MYGIDVVRSIPTIPIIVDRTFGEVIAEGVRRGIKYTAVINFVASFIQRVLSNFYRVHAKYRETHRRDQEGSDGARGG